MNFEVNGRQYFLNFNPSEGEWSLLTPTFNGVQEIEVENDRAPVMQVMTMTHAADAVEN